MSNISRGHKLKHIGRSTFMSFSMRVTCTNILEFAPIILNHLGNFSFRSSNAMWKK